MLRDIGNRMPGVSGQHNNSAASNSDDLRNQYHSAVNEQPARYSSHARFPGMRRDFRS